MHIYTAVLIPFVLMVLMFAVALYLAADIARIVHKSGDALYATDHRRFSRVTRSVKIIIFCVSMLAWALHLGLIIWGDLHFGWLIVSIITYNTAYAIFDVTYEEFSNHWMYNKSSPVLVVLFNKTTTQTWLSIIALAPLDVILLTPTLDSGRYDHEIYRSYLQQ